MSRKRRNSSSVEPDSPPSRRLNSVDFGRDVTEYTTGDQRPQVDASTGQTGAFPGLGDDEEELFYGPATDGIDYLRMVRSERKGIPQLLTATQTRDESDREDEGYYFDGAYTAPMQKVITSHVHTHEAQKHYHASLLANFQLIRATMKCIPPLNVIRSLGESRPISFPPHSKQAKGLWETQMMEQSPHPAQIACMDSDSTLQLVHLMTRKMTHFFKPNEPKYINRLGAWIWAILGKCPDRGELGSEEISQLRNLAQRAADVSNWLSTKQVNGKFDFEEDDESESDRAEEEVVQQQSIDPDSTYHVTDTADTQLQKDVILDAIITVVGEVYGQRDLLDLRRPWLV